MKWTLVALVCMTVLNAAETPIAVSAAAQKQMTELGLRAERLVLVVPKIAGTAKLVVALRNTSTRTYDKVSVTLTLLDKNGNDWNSQPVELQDLSPGTVTEGQASVHTHAHAKISNDKYRLTRIEVFTKEAH
jgi:hypothetical protein